MIKENLDITRKRMEAAARRAGRNPEEITLIAISKTKPAAMIADAYREGQRIFGENKVQEICEKQPLLPKDISWHMVGHLQTNKVRAVVGKVAMIHSVDSIKLAKEIQKEASRQSLICDVLMEVNIAGEDSKYGVSLNEAEEFASKFSEFPNLKLRGLMTVAPYTENSERNRNFFRQMKKLFIDINAKRVDNVSMDILSMGMTGDYEIAIEEGATMIRVGTGIFGERNYF